MGARLGHARGEGARRGDGAPVTALRRPIVGDYVTVVVRGRSVQRAYVCETPEQVERMRKRIGLPWVTPDMLLEADRGTVWALGVDGPEVEALHVATALL